MREIPLYSAEKDLWERLTSERSLAYALTLEPTQDFTLPKALAEKQPDLHYYRSLLASSTWNLNDDVFDPLELWRARNTAEDKPVNHSHVFRDILGHMTSCQVIDAEGKVLTEDTSADALPDLIHVTVGSVLYKRWDKEEDQKRIDQLVHEIAEGKWAVSMECYFQAFDYALLGPDNQSQVVARNSATAFLTKHLRAYGGSGRYDGYRVGRVLRDFFFSGKGLVQNPANPASKIFAAQEKRFGFSTKTISQVYQPHEDKIAMEKDLENKLKEAQDLVKARDQEVATLKTSQGELQVQLDKVKAELQEATAQNKNLGDEVETLKKTLTEEKTRASQLEETLKKAHSELKLLARTTALKVKLGDSAEKFAQTTLALADEDFKAQLDLLPTPTVASKTPPADPKVLDQAQPKNEPAPNPAPEPKGLNLTAIAGEISQLLKKDKA